MNLRAAPSFAPWLLCILQHHIRPRLRLRDLQAEIIEAQAVPQARVYHTQIVHRSAFLTRPLLTMLQVPVRPGPCPCSWSHQQRRLSPVQQSTAVSLSGSGWLPTWQPEQQLVAALRQVSATCSCQQHQLPFEQQPAAFNPPRLTIGGQCRQAVPINDVSLLDQSHKSAAGITVMV
jgi:hypothetical protein